jgi:4-hydroxybenzoyl-CoA reductase subunit beta
MLLSNFEHVRVKTMAEASALLAEDIVGGSLLTAGGTELLPRIKYGLASCRRMVSLKGIKSQAPEVNGQGELVIDALSILADLVTDETVRRGWPMLSAACWEVASNQVRNMATLGGNLCQESRCLYYNQSHDFQFGEPCFKRGGDFCYLIPKGKKCWAVFMSDVATALLSLDARVSIIGPGGERTIPLADIYTGDSRTPIGLAAGEVLEKIMVPAMEPGSGWAYRKFALRGGTEFAGLNLAAVLRVDKASNTCDRARLTMGALTGGPMVIDKIGELLAGKPLNQDLFQEVAAEAASMVRPFPHHGYTAGYLSAVLKEETESLLAQAAQSAAA